MFRSSSTALLASRLANSDDALNHRSFRQEVSNFLPSTSYTGRQFSAEVSFTSMTAVMWTIELARRVGANEG